jgi:hypothetical protein
LLQPLSFEALASGVFPTTFSAGTIRLVSQDVAHLHFDSLVEQIDKISELLASDMQITVIDAELTLIFGGKGSSSQGMITEYLHQLSALGLCIQAGCDSSMSPLKKTWCDSAEIAKTREPHDLC